MITQNNNLINVKIHNGIKILSTIAPEAVNGEKSVFVPNCPRCGNNDPSSDDNRTLIITERYRTSGYMMKCCACNTGDWRFFVPQMDFLRCSQRIPLNAKKVPISWINENI